MEIDDEYVMSSKRLLQICKERKMYHTPELNECCYFHCKGFRRIQNLEPYSECKALWLQSNGLSKIEGLETMRQLTCLYLQENVISEMENLDFPRLKQLNLSNNQIKEVKNTALMPELESLYLACNRIETLTDLAGLRGLQNLSVLDLSKNRIEDEAFVDVLKELPNLKVLILTGNPVARTMHNYRKRIVCACPSLTYLDERPVFEDERRMAVAFMEGGENGAERMREVHAQILNEKRAADRAQFVSMQAFLSGKPREECLRLGEEARSAVLDNFKRTGAIDLYDDPKDLQAQGYSETHQIWKDDAVEIVERAFFEGRVAIRIGIEADELSSSEDDVPGLEKVEAAELQAEKGLADIRVEKIAAEQEEEIIIESQNQKSAAFLTEPAAPSVPKEGRDILPGYEEEVRTLEADALVSPEVVGAPLEIEIEFCAEGPGEEELCGQDGPQPEEDSDSLPD